MVTDFPSNTRRLLARSAFSQELTRFARWLDGEGYTPRVTQQHLLRLEEVLRRLPGTEHREEAVHRRFALVGRGVPSRHFRFEGSERAYCRFLAAEGRLVKTASKGRYDELCSAYDWHMHELRGLSLSARVHHAATIADFLARRGSASRRDLLVNCFGRHQPASVIDAAIAHLISGETTKIDIEVRARAPGSVGRSATIYRLRSDSTS